MLFACVHQCWLRPLFLLAANIGLLTNVCSMCVGACLFRFDVGMCAFVCVFCSSVWLQGLFQLMPFLFLMIFMFLIWIWNNLWRGRKKQAFTRRGRQWKFLREIFTGNSLQNLCDLTFFLNYIKSPIGRTKN